MADVKREIQKRLAEAINNPLIHDNIRRAPDGRIEAIVCWMCSTPIAAWVDEEVTGVNVESGKHTVTVRQRFRTLANYAKAHFELDKGELYTPIVCKNCITKVSESMGEHFLLRDIVLQDKQGAKDDLLIYLMDKKVKRFIGEHVSTRARR